MKQKKGIYISLSNFEILVWLIECELLFQIKNFTNRNQDFSKLLVYEFLKF